MKNKKLIAWQKATNALAQEFCTKYFDTDDWSWVGCPEEIGGVLEVNGYYFGIDRIADALEINCSYELLIQFYEYELSSIRDEDFPRYNFKTWVKYYAGFGFMRGLVMANKKQGIVVKKSKDLNEDLFWQIYDQGVISWIENNYDVENEDYKYCVARENIKLVYDCLKNQIPFFIDLNRKEGDPEVQNIFEVKTGQPEIDWHILLKNDLKRDVIECNREELPKFIAKNYFFKTKHKHYAFKGVNDFVKTNLKNGEEYGKWCYPLEDRNIETQNFLANPINYPEAIVDMLPPCDKFLVSPLVDFNFENEIRVIFCGTEVISLASKHDYKNEAKENSYFTEFGKRYGNKSPYLIWSVDFHPIENGFDIVEAHFYCDLLGRFYGNQDFKKLFEITTNMILNGKN